MLDHINPPSDDDGIIEGDADDVLTRDRVCSPTLTIIFRSIFSTTDAMHPLRRGRRHQAIFGTVLLLVLYQVCGVKGSGPLHIISIQPARCVSAGNCQAWS